MTYKEAREYLIPVAANCVLPQYAAALEKAMEALEIAESVVRCKECKHSRERNEYEKEYLVEGVLICTSPDVADDCWLAVWPENYCSYGERRADNEM